MADTARTSAALKLFFETGDVPTQQQFADFITSYANLVDNNQLDGMDLTITAHAGGGQASAYPIVKQFNIITVCATNGNSVKLPVALPKMVCVIANNTPQVADIFPISGEQIYTYDPDDALEAVPLSYTIFTCIEVGVWVIQQSFFTTKAIRVYKANLTQSGAAAPTATILENTLDSTLAWSYDGTGRYKTNTFSAGFFPPDKTFIRVYNNTTLGTSTYTIGGSNNYILLQTYNLGVDADDELNGGNITIEVYP